MQKKAIKTNIKKAHKWSNVRVSSDTKTLAEKLLKRANNKQSGRKIKIDELFNIALKLIEECHLKSLQSQSISNEDRKEQLRQCYIKKHGPISKDDFTGFMLSPAYFDFLNEQSLNQ